MTGRRSPWERFRVGRVCPEPSTSAPVQWFPHRRTHKLGAACSRPKPLHLNSQSMQPHACCLRWRCTRRNPRGFLVSRRKYLRLSAMGCGLPSPAACAAISKRLIGQQNAHRLQILPRLARTLPQRTAGTCPETWNLECLSLEFFMKSRTTIVTSAICGVVTFSTTPFRCHRKHFRCIESGIHFVPARRVLSFLLLRPLAMRLVLPRLRPLATPSRSAMPLLLSTPARTDSPFLLN